MSELSVYRLDFLHVLRLTGVRMIVAATLVVAAAVMLSFETTGIRAIGYVAGAAAVVVIGVSVVLLLRPPVVLVLDATGYRVSRLRGSGLRGSGLRGSGLRTGSWAEVKRVENHTTGLGQSLVIELESGETTRVPLILVVREAGRLQLEVHERLNAAHKYRPYDPAEFSGVRPPDSPQEPAT